MGSGWKRVAPMVALAAVAACAPMRKSADDTPPSSVAMDKGGVVLTGAALTDGPGSVLAAMEGKVPNFRVHRLPGGQCPEITLRKVGNFSRTANPHVYIDGTHATDTCVLQDLRTDDVDRIEVYPQGFTTRPGYGRHASGLILVFMRSG